MGTKGYLGWVFQWVGIQDESRVLVSEGWVCQGRSGNGYVKGWICPETWDTMGYSQQAGGIHPTGMLSSSQ